MLNTEVDEVSVDKDVIWRSKLRVVLEEKTNFLLFHFLDRNIVDF